MQIANERTDDRICAEMSDMRERNIHSHGLGILARIQRRTKEIPVQLSLRAGMGPEERGKEE